MPKPSAAAAVPLARIVSHLDEYLRIAAIEDYPQARNGLQLENSGTIRRIVAAVDACAPVIAKAAAQPGVLLLVHHGLFWEDGFWIGARYRKMKTAIERDLAIYSAHLPLDIHPKVGNAACFVRALGFTKSTPFLRWKGQALGVRIAVRMTRAELVRRSEQVLGARPHLCAGGPARIRSVGIVTGGAGSEVAQAHAEGVDTFITGEGPHWSYTLAEELGVNILYGGHYATETFGVKALAAHLAKRFKLPWDFIDHPTGL
jgi:dinuclear metal center YbgI/SA1388 family protein